MPERPRLLWLASTLMPAMAKRVNVPHAMAGPWIAQLLEEVKKNLDCEICFAAPFTTTKKIEFDEDRVRYIIFPRPRRLRWGYSWDGLEDAAKLINEYRPSLIHVHGSEHCLGLAHRHAGWNGPTILSLQGILNACVPKALGDIDSLDALRSERLIDLLRNAGVMGVRRTWRKGASVEREILLAHAHFIGHTEWDKLQLYALNPDAKYHRVGEPLRREFARQVWQLSSCTRHRVFFGNLAGAHKGGHTILRALRLLARQFPEVHFRVAGRLGTKRGYGRLFIREAMKLGVEDRVNFLGFLDAERMAEELASAHVFVSASHVDNNPNSVGEAQCVGTPIVGSYVGGVPEMLGEGRAGLMFPAGDAEVLAARIAQVFSDNALAESISGSGRAQATKRHDPKSIVNDLLDAYALAGCAVTRRIGQGAIS